MSAKKIKKTPAKSVEQSTLQLQPAQEVSVNKEKSPSPPLAEVSPSNKAAVESVSGGVGR